MKKNYSNLAVAFVAILAIGLVGCSDDDENNPVANPAPTPQLSNVLVVHASPDAPGVDILVDNAAPAVTNPRLM